MSCQGTRATECPHPRAFLWNSSPLSDSPVMVPLLRQIGTEGGGPCYYIRPQRTGLAIRLPCYIVSCISVLFYPLILFLHAGALYPLSFISPASGFRYCRASVLLPPFISTSLFLSCLSLSFASFIPNAEFF